jgi:hypothetical protein
MSLLRFYDLENEFRQISAKIARTTNTAELLRLQQLRNKIAAEARQIVNELGILEPVWCWSSP